MPPLNPSQHVRRVTYRFRSTDVRKYALNETLRRARAAVVRAGGVLVSGEKGSRPAVRRWCVLRSPHVNKTSREHFWLRTHKRAFDWDAELGRVDDAAEEEIAAALPANVAVRVEVDAPAVARLREVWDTMQKSKGGLEEIAAKKH